MYNLEQFAEDYKYLCENMNHRHETKMKNMPRFYSNKSKAGAYKMSLKWHVIKPMMSRHGDFIRVGMKLVPYSIKKNYDHQLENFIRSTANIISSNRLRPLAIGFDTDYAGAESRKSADIEGFFYAVKDINNAKTGWEKMCIRNSANTGDYSNYNMNRRRLANIPKNLQIVKAWSNYSLYEWHKNEAHEFASQNHPLNWEFVSNYKYRAITNRRMQWFHAGLVRHYVYLSHDILRNNVETHTYASLQDALSDAKAVYGGKNLYPHNARNVITRAILMKMSKVNDITSLIAWEKMLKNEMPSRISTTFAKDVAEYITDGMNMNNLYADPRKTKIDIITMSITEMIAASINNHRIDAERLRIYGSSNVDAAREMPTLELPEVLENVRIKTAGEMIEAGKTLSHCIGSYADDQRHMFFRKNTVCAMVSMETLSIIQCFDIRNKRTAASKKFESFLQKELKKVTPLKRSPVSVTPFGGGNHEYEYGINDPVF